ncbi:hypothetical protein DPM19_10990 [Actinomadura craniellae]|uniref:Uncharacterized protein n=1 Tax=Actinomadura craniellae TaxID=2231787 RepID=A0A365H832_9ACTN|nr:hypothetical protein DPM19_10990 [Actinomadura craniellae]
MVVLAFTVFNTNQMSDTEKLTAAARNLSTAKAMTLNGTFGSASNQFTGELKVTSGGRQTGQVTWGSHRVTILQADGNFFAKGNRAFWTDKGRYTGDAEFLNTGEHWGRLESFSMPIGFKDNLTTTAIVNRMRQLTRYSIRSSERTTLKGEDVDKITTFSATYYLTTDDEPQLVRIESTSSPTISADVKVQGSSDGAGTISEIRSRIGELKDSFDPTKNPRVQEWSKGGCNASGCPVRAKVWTVRGSSSSVLVNVHFTITADTRTGRHLGDCTTSVTITGIDGVWAECRVTSSAWTSWFNAGSGTKTWWKHADLTAAGASEGDITTMQNALDRE